MGNFKWFAAFYRPFKGRRQWKAMGACLMWAPSSLEWLRMSIAGVQVIGVRSLVGCWVFLTMGLGRNHPATTTTSHLQSCISEIPCREILKSPEDGWLSLALSVVCDVSKAEATPALHSVTYGKLWSYETLRNLRWIFLFIMSRVEKCHFSLFFPPPDQDISKKVLSLFTSADSGERAVLYTGMYASCLIMLIIFCSA